MESILDFQRCAQGQEEEEVCEIVISVIGEAFKEVEEVEWINSINF